MARINLVPWRQERRKRKQQQFLVLLGGCVLATLAGIGLWHLYNESVIDNQLQRNKMLQGEIAKVNVKLKEIEGLDETRRQLLTRMDVIQALQRSRPESVHMMDEMVFVMPEGVILDKISQAGTRVDLAGRAESNARVSALMRNVESSQWMSVPSLRIVENKAAEAGDLNNFGLVYKQARPKGDEQ